MHLSRLQNFSSSLFPSVMLHFAPPPQPTHHPFNLNEPHLFSNCVGLTSTTMTRLAMMSAAATKVTRNTLPLLAGNLPLMIQYYDNDFFSFRSRPFPQRNCRMGTKICGKRGKGICFCVPDSRNIFSSR